MSGNYAWKKNLTKCNAERIRESRKMWEQRLPDVAFFLGKSGLLQKFLYKKAYSSNNNSNNSI